jgi:D-citramalate synthase
MGRKIEIMDTTLRDGEQTSGVAFLETEKLTIARMLLDEVKVDRIEIASAKVSAGEFRSAERIFSWACKKGYLDRVEVLGFIDGTASIDWILKAGGRVINLLTKGSLNHVQGQLRKTPEQHLADIKNSIAYAIEKKMLINVYLEDWSNGMKNSRDYVYFLMDNLKNEPIKRYMLPDTLGILNPDETAEYCKLMLDRYPGLHFDFHAHNDYDLATGNVLASVLAGVAGVHTTVNGLGERAGNVPLTSVVAVLTDHLKAELSVQESMIYQVSRMVETFSGIRIPHNKPVIGENVFTQTCGVHADGDNKDKLYFNDLMPERFGRVRQYALGKTAGKANILKNLEELGVDLSPEEMKLVTQKVIELGDKKETVTREDLPYIIADVLNSEVIQQKIRIVNYSLNVAKGLKSVATVSLDILGKVYEETASGDGQYDAFMNAVKKIYTELKKPIPRLVDYTVSIPPGGKTDALVESLITWDDGNKEFKTRGLDPDQTVAAITATLKMLNLIEG